MNDIRMHPLDDLRAALMEGGHIPCDADITDPDLFRTAAEMLRVLNWRMAGNAPAGESLTCFRVLDGGETHYIVARDEDEARDMFVEECNSDDGALLDAKFKALTRDDMCKVKIRATLADLFDDADKPCVLAGTID